MSKFIEFVMVTGLPAKKYTIVNKRSNDVLGTIEYYAKWRMYIVGFEPMTIWSEDCLADVRQALIDLNAGKEPE